MYILNNVILNCPADNSYLHYYTFLNNILDFDEFKTAFSLLYEEVREKVDIFTIDLEQIDKFQPSTRSYRFASFMGSTYRGFEEVEDEYCTEQELKDSVKEDYLELQNFLNEE